MRKLDLSSAVFFLCLAIAVMVQSVGLKIGTLGKPGPGFFPFGGALVVGASSTVLLLQSVFQRNGRRKAEDGEKIRWWSVACLLGAVAVYALLLDVLGFAVCTFLMFVFILRVVTSQRWPRALLVAAVASVGAHVLFQVLLRAQLPTGFLGF